MHAWSKGGFVSALMLSLGFVLAGSGSASGETHWVNDDGGLPIPPGTNCNNRGYATIQAAVNVAAPGDRINVCAGTYLEQVTIPAGKNNLELRSVSHWQAVIKAPPVMMPDSFGSFTIVRIAGAQNVTLLAFTITGPGTACGSLSFGVRVDSGGSANILGNHITDIRDALPPPALCGSQNGVAIQVGRQFNATTGSARIIGNVIERYQKNGPTIDNMGSHAEIKHNRILGVGPSATIAQNGIQVSRGATADVQHNFVSGHLFTPQTFAASGIILFQPGEVLTQHNTVTLNDVGVNFFGSTSQTVTAYNLVRASTFDGIALFPATLSQVSHNRTTENSGPGIGLYDSENNAIRNNVVKDNVDSGILLDNADDNDVGHNEVMRNGTDASDTTDGIRVNTLSEANTIRNNQLRNNVTHDCHDDSMGAGTAATANQWVDNHAGTENRSGLCHGASVTMTLEATTAFGWDPNYRWYDSFGGAGEYDWATAYAGIDTDSLLQLVPAIQSGGGGRKLASPHP
jgi:parallel beta-helix repeat protein